MVNYRNNRISGEMKKEIADIIQNQIKDPRLGFVSIVGIEVSRDLATAKVFISHLGNEESLVETMKALESASGFIRRELSHRCKTRTVPELCFYADHSIEYGMKINKMLTEVIPPNPANADLDKE